MQGKNTNVQAHQRRLPQQAANLTEIYPSFPILMTADHIGNKTQKDPYPRHTQ